MIRRRHKKSADQPELDITAFMNLMIVLVPVLLLSMVFAQNTVLELNFPTLDDSKILDNPELQIQVILRQNTLVVADSKGGLIRKFPAINRNYDFKALQQLLIQLKQKLPQKKDIAILSEQDIDYQSLVSAMDTVKSYPAVVAASVVRAELFPDVSIGDAPDISTVQQVAPVSAGAEK